MKNNNITIGMTIMSIVVAISLISGTAYAQQQQQQDPTMMDKSQKMDKSHDKYFAIQDTKISMPDNFAPEHQQYHQIAVILPPQGDKIYMGEVSYSASAPVNVFVMQPLNKTVTENATAVPLSNLEGGFAVSGSHILDSQVADNVDFAGSAVYFHSRSSEPFTVAYTTVGKVVEPTPLYK